MQPPTPRQIRLALEERHGAALQQRISGASVAVCGLGGLGSHIALTLARAGVGHLRLIDFDKVDLSNLNRQQYAVSQLGQYKTEALRDTLQAVAPCCRVTCHTLKVTDAHIPTLFPGDSVIIEAFDRAEAKAMLVSGVLENWPSAWLIACSGMAGLGSSNTIHTRRVSRRFYLCGDETTDSADGLGLMAPRVMLCAAHAANMALRLIAGLEDP